MAHENLIEIELIRNISDKRLRKKVENRANELINSDYEIISISFSYSIFQIPACYISKIKRKNRN